MISSAKNVSVKQCHIASVGYTCIYRYITLLFLVFSDYTAITLSILTAWHIRATLLPSILNLTSFDINANYIYFILPAIYVLFFMYEGLYIKRLPLYRSLEILFKICTYVSILAISIMYFTDKSNDVSRIFVMLVWCFSFAYLAFFQYFTKRLLATLGLWQRPVVMIGAGKTAELIASSFTKDPYLGYKIVALIEDDLVNKPLINEYPCIAPFAYAEAAICKSGVKDVIIATPGLPREELVALIYRLQPYAYNLIIVPDLFGIPLSNIEVETLFNEQTVMLKMHNNLSSIKNRSIKRIFDIIVGSLIFMLACPLLFIISLIILFDSKGGVMHNAKRMGKNGVEFCCYKFRTMHPDSDRILERYLADNILAKMEWEKFAKLKNYDPRVTRVGKYLRKYSLDELPQIINVLMGSMSLVGPRPYLPREREAMDYVIYTILETVPGITGLWQVNGRNKNTFDERLQLDAWYVRNWSLWLDITLLIKTIKVVMKKEGAY